MLGLSRSRRCQDELAESRQNTQALTQVVNACSKARNLPEMLRAALEAIRASFGWTYGCYFAMEHSDRTLRFSVDSGAVSEELRQVAREIRFQEGMGLVGRAWRSRDLAIAVDESAIPDSPMANVMKKLKLVSAFALPVIINNEVAGGMKFLAPSRVEMGQERQEVMRALGQVISNAVARFDSLRLQAMLEQAPLNIIYADTDLKIRYLNSTSQKMLQRLEKHLPIRADQMLGQSIDIFHKNPEHQRRMMADPRRLPHQADIQLGDETLSLHIIPILDGERKPTGFMLSWDVITERLRMQAELKQKSDAEAMQAAQTAEQAEALRVKVDQILQCVQRVADGDFTTPVPDLGDDAIGQVGTALNDAVDSIRETLEQVREVARTLLSASQELSSASTEISTGAQEQASNLEETASSLEQITATIRQNSDSAQQARQFAEGSREVAENGGRVVSSAVEAMNEINRSSKKIADIITAIDEIAFQTNLLALNAAVEAARAGEQGRGFAVVAAEVRNLAQRSAGAAKEIKGLIQDSVRKVETGSELVNHSGNTLSEIVTSVKRVTDIVAEIASASREQSTGIEQINKAVTQMDTITQRNASQTEELSGTSQALATQAEQLMQLVSRFQLGAESGETHRMSHGHDAPSTRMTKPAPRAKKVEMPRGDRFKPAGSGAAAPNGSGHELDRIGSGFEEF